VELLILESQTTDSRYQCKRIEIPTKELTQSLTVKNLEYFGLQPKQLKGESSVRAFRASVSD